MHHVGPGVPYERLLTERRPAALAQLRERDALGAAAHEPQRLPVVAREALGGVEPQCAADQRVVAHLRVGVERQVVAGQGHVRVEQRPQPALHRRPDRAGVKVPEQPVVTQDQLRALGRRALEQLELGRYTGDHHVDGRGAGHLEAVGPVVVEGFRVEKGVEEADDLVACGHSTPHRTP